MLTARNCWSVGKQPHQARKARESSILWKTTSSLIVHSLLLQHIPPGRLILQEGQKGEEGTWEAAEKEGTEQSAKKRKKHVPKGSQESTAEGTEEDAKSQKHKAGTAV